MKMVITLHTYQLVLPCLLGVEGLVAEELRDMGAENVAPENGRVLCAGSPEMIARANIRSRFAERVLVLLGTFEAKSFESLFRGVKALPWTEWIGRDDAFPVKGRCLSSQLMSVPDCQAIIKKAVVESLKEAYKLEHFPETGANYQIQFLIMKRAARGCTSAVTAKIPTKRPSKRRSRRSWQSFPVCARTARSSTLSAVRVRF